MDLTGRNSRVGVGVGVTIGVEQYQFIKPQLYMEVDVHPNENPDQVIEDLEKYLAERLVQLEEKLEKYVKP